MQSYKNVIIEKNYYANEHVFSITVELPFTHLNPKHFKIEKALLTFYRSQYFKYVSPAQAILSDANGADVYNKYDPLNNAIVPMAETNLTALTYMTSNQNNNCVIMNNNYNFNLISLASLTENPARTGFIATYESDYHPGTNTIVLNFVNQNLKKLCIQNIYLNIKLKYDNNTEF
jgi:hypothetical protein